MGHTGMGTAARIILIGVVAAGFARGAAMAGDDRPAPPAPATEKAPPRPPFDGTLPGDAWLAVQFPAPAGTGARVARKLTPLLGSVEMTPESLSAFLPMGLAAFMGGGTGRGMIDLLAARPEIAYLRAAPDGRASSAWFLPGVTAEQVAAAWAGSGGDGHGHSPQDVEEAMRELRASPEMEEYAAEAIEAMDRYAAESADDPRVAGMFSAMGSWMRRLTGDTSAGAEAPPGFPFQEETTVETLGDDERDLRYRVARPDGRQYYAWTARPFGACAADADLGEDLPHWLAQVDTDDPGAAVDVAASAAEDPASVTPEWRAAATARAFAWLSAETLAELPAAPDAADGEAPVDARVLVDLAKLRRAGPLERPAFVRGGSLSGVSARAVEGVGRAYETLLAGWRGMALDVSLAGDGYGARAEFWPETPADRARPAVAPSSFLDAVPEEAAAVLYLSRHALRTPAAGELLKDVLGLRRPERPEAMATEDLKLLAVRLAALEAALREVRSFALAWVPDRNEVPHGLALAELGTPDDAKAMAHIVGALFAGQAECVQVGVRLAVAFGPRAKKLAERLDRDWRLPRKGVTTRWREGLAALGDAPAGDGFFLLYPGDAWRSTLAGVEEALYRSFLNTIAGRITTVRLAAPRSPAPVALAWGLTDDGRTVASLHAPDATVRELKAGMGPMAAVLTTVVDFDMVNLYREATFGTWGTGK